MDINTQGSICKVKEVSLKSGDLTITINESDFDIDDITSYATRNNRKRGFMFVNKLLAKYLPSDPKDMINMHDHLASKIPQLIDNRPMFIGMAEAAAGFGQGVYESHNRLKLDDSMFIHTTRYYLEGFEYVEFEESHSHASDFYLYIPNEPELRQQFLTTKSLVLVDDEVTTGNTFKNLIKSYMNVNPMLEEVIVLTMLDFVSDEDVNKISTECGVPVTFISSVSASVEFHKNPEHIPENIPDVNSNKDDKTPILSLEYGRVGIKGVVRFNVDYLQTKLEMINSMNHNNILVLGVGEFTHTSLVLADILSKYYDGTNTDIKVQSTARSPLLVGESIKTVITFEDSYGDNIPNYLYNVSQEDYDIIIVCHETKHVGSLSNQLEIYPWRANDENCIID